VASPVQSARSDWESKPEEDGGEQALILGLSAGSSWLGRRRRSGLISGGGASVLEGVVHTRHTHSRHARRALRVV
jgi:hypothetical protein